METEILCESKSHCIDSLLFSLLYSYHILPFKKIPKSNSSSHLKHETILASRIFSEMACDKETPEVAGSSPLPPTIPFPLYAVRMLTLNTFQRQPPSENDKK
jgi:hypothetical protein